MNTLIDYSFENGIYLRKSDDNNDLVNERWVHKSAMAILEKCYYCKRRRNRMPRL